MSTIQALADSVVQSKTYSEDQLPEFTPIPWTMNEIRSAIPPYLHSRQTRKGMFYLTHDIIIAFVLWKAARYIEISSTDEHVTQVLSPVGSELVRWGAWIIYWWFQGLVFTGIWVIGHECGHGAFSPSKPVCDLVGFITHTFLWTPYFSWKISHHNHHSNHASIEHDAGYIPKTRSDLGIPKEGRGEVHYEEYFGDTPIYTMLMLIRQQLFGFAAYLLFNVSGPKAQSKWTSHFNPSSVLFTPQQRNAVIISNIGIASMVCGVIRCSKIWGASEVMKYYGVPWLFVSHWTTMITYLHHTDIEIPHYRSGRWNFQRGAAATVDRDFLGWQGRFFLHDVAHFHVIHHFFPMIPFYNAPMATKYLKEFIGDHYRYSGKPVFQALWETYNQCQFVEDEGDIVFYRDRKGQARIRPAVPYRITDEPHGGDAK